MDETPSEPLTHEQKVARLLELEEAREARRVARAGRWRALAPLIAFLVVVAGFTTWGIANEMQKQEQSERRSCEIFHELSGTPADC